MTERRKRLRRSGTRRAGGRSLGQRFRRGFRRRCLGRPLRRFECALAAAALATGLTSFPSEAFGQSKLVVAGALSVDPASLAEEGGAQTVLVKAGRFHDANNIAEGTSTLRVKIAISSSDDSRFSLSSPTPVKPSASMETTLNSAGDELTATNIPVTQNYE